MISQSECQKKVDDELKTMKLRDNKIENKVQVKIMKIDWMFKNSQNFMGIVNMLNNCDSVAILETEFVKIIMNHFWEYY